MKLEDYVAIAARLFEAAGVLVMLVGAVLAPVFAYRAYRRSREVTLYRLVRRKVGGSILLGLELLVAADIIRTVSESPTLRQVAILGGIVLIRTFLSFTLEVELEGRWPWQKGRAEGSRARTGSAPAPGEGETSAAPKSSGGPGGEIRAH